MPLLAARATSRPAASSSASPCRSVLLSQPQKPLRARIAPTRMPAPTSPSRIVVRATSTPTTLLDKIRSFFNPEAAVAAPPAPPAVVRPPPVSPETVPSWSELEAAALSAADIGDYSVRPGAVPASYRAKVLGVSPTDAAEPPPPSAAPVLFFSDTNSWCPFAQRVSFYLKLRGDLPHEIALIDLRNKPPYYPKLVPTSKVPAVFVKARDAPADERGELVYESLDILAKLEDMYPEGALAPSDPAAAKANAEALQGADALVMAAFGLVRAVAPPPPAGSPYAAMGPPPSPEEARASLEAKLDKFEELLGTSSGPFLGGASPATADVALAPQLERVAATLPASAAKFAIRGADAATGKVNYPRVTAWFDALEALPAYQETRGDAGTHRAVSKRLLGSSLAEPKFAPRDARAAAECAAKISKNREAIKKDILKNAGLAPFGSSETSSELADDVDNALRRLVSTLVSGHPGPAAQAPATFASPPEPAAAARAAATNAVAAAVAAFMASRVSAPRDMSGSAAEELRGACLRVAQGAFTGL